MTLIMDVRKLALNRRLLQDALKCEPEVVTIEEVAASKQRLEATYEYGGRAAVELLTRRTLLASLASIPVALSPMVSQAQRGPLSGHTPFSINAGKFWLIDYLSMHNEWTNLPGFDQVGSRRLGQRVAELRRGSMYGWVECCVLGGAWYDNGKDGTISRQGVLKLLGRHNGLRRSALLGSSGHNLNLNVGDCCWHAFGARVVNSVLANSDEGAVHMAHQSGEFQFGRNSIRNTIFYDLANSPRSSTYAHAVKIEWDNTFGSWYDNFEALNCFWQTGSTIRVAGDVSGMTNVSIKEAATSFPGVFGGAVIADHPGFRDYSPDPVPMTAFWSRFALTASSPCRNAGTHLTRLSTAVTGSANVTFQDPTWFRYLGPELGHPRKGPYAAAGGMGCYIEGVGYVVFESHNPETGVTTLTKPITAPVGAKVWDLTVNSDIGAVQTS
jgi:hypothetical protein